MVQINAIVGTPQEGAMPTLERFSGFSVGKGTAAVPRPLKTAAREGIDDVLRLPPLPASSVFIGDLRLAALKARLATAAISANLAGGGVLVCRPAASPTGSDAVLVKKADRGELVVEGAAGQLFAEVRRFVYALHAAT